MSKEDRFEPADIAKLAHETNRIYCQLLGDFSQSNWDNAPDWQKTSVINGVKFHLENPNAGQAASHHNWLKEKEADGWKYGEVKDVDKKEHPCYVDYEDLPVEQQIKDALFVGIVRTLKVLL